MNIYPALRSQMGTWNYYTVKMNAHELSQNVMYASEVHEDRTLDEAIQRILKESRVKKDIVEYLKRQPNRFFSTIVVAALGGEPLFYPVEITDDPRFVVFRNNSRLNETFGVLQFDGTQKYYALDGQHRLAAIKTLLDRSDPASDGKPEDFDQDEFSVIVIVPNREESHETFMQKYRRLFSNLNRYAKPMDQATNIIMDEDDTFAILTRRLITENDFFKSAGRQRESRRIKTQGGKNLREKEPYFTSIITLYEMNIELLKSSEREANGWGPIKEESATLKTFVRFRPSEEYIDDLYDELTIYWEALLAELPILKNEPTTMRIHSVENSEVENNDGTDHLLFWPIGQEILATVVRGVLDKRLDDMENPTLETAKAALKGLSQLEWRLHQPPWRYFLLIQNLNGEWTMRNEQRPQAIRCGCIIQRWLLGLESDDEDFAKGLKNQWKALLIPAQSEESIDQMWEQVEKIKANIVL